jgi:hypothetical protein
VITGSNSNDTRVCRRVAGGEAVVKCFIQAPLALGIFVGLGKHHISYQFSDMGGPPVLLHPFGRVEAPDWA